MNNLKINLVNKKQNNWIKLQMKYNNNCKIIKKLVLMKLMQNINNWNNYFNQLWWKYIKIKNKIKNKIKDKIKDKIIKMVIKMKLIDFLIYLHNKLIYMEKNVGCLNIYI